MKIQDAFPSPFLKAADVGEGGTRFTMSDIRQEEVGVKKDLKHVLYFRGQKKGLVLNKINMKTIAKYYGDETDNWPGNEIILYSTMVEFQGDMVEGIRVRQERATSHQLVAKQEEAVSQPNGEPPPSILTEAQAITRGGIDRFRDWRDRLSEMEIEELRPHMTQLIQSASAATPPPPLSAAAKKITEKKLPKDEIPF